MAVEALLSPFVKVLIMSSEFVLHEMGVPWGLQEEFEKLQRTLEQIQSIVGDAEEQQSKDSVKKWLIALRDAAYDAENVLDEFHYGIIWKERTDESEKKMIGKVRDFFSPHNPVYFRLRMACKLKQVVKRIDDIAAESNKFNFTAHTQPQSSVLPETHPYVAESNVIGRDKDKEEIVRQLIGNDKNENIAVLPIVGMGGLGKTTLAQLIYNDQQLVQKHFQLRIWVCVSDVFDVKNIVRAIISSGTGTECELSNMDLLQRRVREVLTGKRYLLVLDNVWNENSEKWDSLKALLDCGGKGSTVVVTTRSNRVAQIMGRLTTYRLKRLSEEDSWSLFKKSAFANNREEHPPQNLVETGKSIVKKCDGLPLALKFLGSLMSDKSDEMEWSAVMESDIWDAKVENILPALRLSYKNLPLHCKQCFAYCAVFPKDYLIKEDMLIQLWMAQGFIPRERAAQPEVKGHQIFMELVHRSFFQVVRQVRHGRYGSDDEGYCSSVKVCKMHGLIHDLAQHVAGEQLKPSTAVAVAPRNAVHHLSIQGTISSNIHETLRNFPALRTLLVRGRYRARTLEIIPKPTTLRFCKKKKATTLRVLEFHNISARMLLNLAHLKHVRYLDLSHTAISELPRATTTLLHLQTLKLSGCEQLRKLPNDMKNMSNLRHLHLDGCSRLRYMPKDLGRLSWLQTLSKYIVGDDAGTGIGELKKLHLSGQLELYNLRNVRDVAAAKEANLHSKHNLHSLALCWGVLDWTREISLSENVETTLSKKENAKTRAENAEASKVPLSENVEPSPSKKENTEKIAESEKRTSEISLSDNADAEARAENEKRTGETYLSDNANAETTIAETEKKTSEISPFDNADAETREKRAGEIFFSDNADDATTVQNEKRTSEIILSDNVDAETRAENEKWTSEISFSCNAETDLSKKENAKTIAENEKKIKEAEAVLEGLQPPSNIKVLSIWRYGGVVFPTWISDHKMLPQHLVEIHLGGCRRCQRLPSFWRLPSLEVLSLRRMDAVKHIICGESGDDYIEQAFPLLKRLVLDGMPSLEQWWEKGGGAAEGKCFPQLADLIISGCSKLGPMPMLPSLKFLKVPTDNRMLLGSIKNLSALAALDIGIDHSPRASNTSSSVAQEMVSLTHLEYLETLQIFGCNELLLQLVQEDDMKESSLGLRQLIAHNCDWLFTLRQSKFWKSLTFLQTLKIRSCGGLSSFPEEFQGLTSLKSLLLHYCDNLADFSTTLPSSSSSSSSSSREGLPPHLEDLDIYSCNGLKKLPRCPASLKRLAISSCRSLTSLTEDTNQLTSLEGLCVASCPNLSSLPEQLTMLGRLHIIKCPKLKSLPQSLCTRTPSLESLEIRGCPELERRFKRGQYCNLKSGIQNVLIVE